MTYENVPGRWQRLLVRWLTHRVDIVRKTGTDNFGMPADGVTVNAVPCFIAGARSRTPTEGSQDAVPNYEVSFLRDVDVQLNDRLVNGRARDGMSLLPEGRVVRIDPTVHPVYGELVRTATVARA